MRHAVIVMRIWSFITILLSFYSLRLEVLLRNKVVDVNGIQWSERYLYIFYRSPFRKIHKTQFYMCVAIDIISFVLSISFVRIYCSRANCTALNRNRLHHFSLSFIHIRIMACVSKQNNIELQCIN